ncbi:MAG: penicillin-binding transpeptidase domain-containing protein, partial [Clostridia bacterium]
MNSRYRIIYLILALISFAFVIKLVSLQLVNGESYRQQSEMRTTKTVVLEAPRGDITDRYGRTLVTNKMSNTIVIRKTRDQDDALLNETIKKLYSLADESGFYISTTFPVNLSDEGLYFVFEESGDNPKAKEYAWKEKYSMGKHLSAEDALEFFAKKYNVTEENTIIKLKITSTRYEMTLRDFSYTTDFNFATGVPMDMITAIKEQFTSFPGVDIKNDSAREYKYPSIATHVLGRVGKISAEELESMSSFGYTMNSLTGKQGIEKYAEQFLCGTNGLATVEQTKEGRSISEETVTEAVPGKNVTLTIDIDLQMEAEKALHETIIDVRSNAKNVSEGIGADSGAVVAVDVNTGEILAMASYPTYDISNFNVNYSSLLTDSARPLFNRAVAGEYSPGSTFKMLVAAGALEEGIISPWDVIVDKGIYQYYKDYQPRCWAYRQHGTTHGAVNVSGAIRDSCNYFFYDVGRRLGIDKIAEYAALLGFGEKTGVEIPGEEHSGTVASVENREKSGGVWYPGDTLQASIGQSDTLVTPVQLASYVATIANGGTRYKLHIVKSVEDKNGKTVMEKRSEVLSRINLTDENYEAITKGMRLVVTEGTGKVAFQGCIVDVAAKSGSAQMGRYTNGIYVAYAPYDNPQ